VTRPDLMQLAAEERRDLADFLTTLSDEQWDAPSLCEGWSVRQVVAHMISYEDMTMPQMLRLFPRGGFRITRVNHLVLSSYDDVTPADLLADLRRHERPRGVTAGFRGAIALTDGLIHHQDIRRPLGAARTVPSERLVGALGFAPRALALPSRRQVRGLRLVATDLDWSRGEGPEVRGPGEALLLAIAGRPAALADLDGPGAPLLTERLAPAGA
jgi:uncharacterized protein (TIGR03083 family)